MAELLVVGSETGAVADIDGSGLICSAVTNNRFNDVPSGVQVIRVNIGLSV